MMPRRGVIREVEGMQCEHGGGLRKRLFSRLSPPPWFLVGFPFSVSKFIVLSFPFLSFPLSPLPPPLSPSLSVPPPSSLPLPPPQLTPFPNCPSRPDIPTPQNSHPHNRVLSPNPDIQCEGGGSVEELRFCGATGRVDVGVEDEGFEEAGGGGWA